MTQEHYRHIKEIFQDAIDLPLEERPAYLDSACGSDHGMRAEVESLLAAHEAKGTQLMDEPLAKLAPDLGKQEAQDVPGKRIGPYRIERLLGEGGMGVVYEASRADDQFRQRVALKLVRSAAYSEAVLRRFRQERQILAMLAHPHIARLLDGGVTEQGQPYFVMEYVEGKPISDYCHEKRLGVRERLLLFRDVCAANEFHTPVAERRHLRENG